MTTKLDTAEVKEIDEILTAAQGSEKLDDREDDFVNQLTDRFERFRERTFMSEAQWEFLRRIGRKVGSG